MAGFEEPTPEEEEIFAAIAQVVDAYRIPGRNPEYHLRQQKRLEDEWPMLHRAILRLVEATR